MIIGYVSIWEGFYDMVFNEHQKETYGQNLFKHFLELKSVAAKRGIQIGYVRDFDLGNIDAFLFHDVPADDNVYFIYARQHRKPMFLFSDEPEAVWPRSHQVSLHESFAKIFTYNDYWVDNQRYMKVTSFPFDFDDFVVPRPSKKKLCTMINSSKLFPHYRELYLPRLEVVRWFESNHPADFDLYGQRWNPEQFPSYRGVTPDKLRTMADYKFVICYENERDVPGYITEKLFDCFLAGSVPIYWGASNIEQYIPSTCYIDKRRFATYEELYNFLTAMSDAEYDAYFDAMEEFCRRQTDSVFSIRNFVTVLLDTMCAELGTGRGVQGVDDYPPQFDDRSLGWWIYYAREKANAGNHEEAVKVGATVFRAVTADGARLHPKISVEQYYVELIALLARSLSALQKYAEGLQWCAEFRNFMPDHPDLSFYEAEFHAQIGYRHLTQSGVLIGGFVKEYNDFDKRRPHDLHNARWKATLLNADLLRLRGLVDEAYRGYRHALQRTPQYLGAYNRTKHTVEELGHRAQNVVNLRNQT